LSKVATMNLNFAAPDLLRFPCLRLAYQALRAAGTAAAMLNAANEEAVAAFLAKKIMFPAIAQVIETVLNGLPVTAVSSLEDVLAADETARQAAQQRIQELIK